MPRPLGFLGLEIDRRTDVLALAAFLLSIATVIAQVVSFLHGSDVQLFPPEQVIIAAWPYPGEGVDYVRIGARMAYVNKGQAGYNDVVRRELTRFSVGSVVYEQQWQSFGFLTNEGERLLQQGATEARPEAVNAGSARSHETFFGPRTVPVESGEPAATRFKNFLPWDDFMSQIANAEELEFHFLAETFNGTKLDVKCKVYVTPELKVRFKDKKWEAPSCWG